MIFLIADSEKFFPNVGDSFDVSDAIELPVLQVLIYHSDF